MAEKIQRQTQKIFGGSAPNDSLAVFGSMITGNPIYTDNIETLQSPAYEQGWESAIAANEAPFLEEMNGVQYGFSKQLAYQFQEGMAEYDPATVYFKDSWCKGSDSEGNVSIYQSLIDENIGNPLTDTNSWKVLPVSEIGNQANTSLSNLTPEGEKHFLNYTQITDCIIEKPSRVNVECANGTATVKAGSVVIVPYGIDAPTLSIGDYLAGNLNNNNFKIVDIQYKNNQLFYWVEVQRDISDNQAGDDKIHERTLYVSLNGNTPAAWVNSYSGAEGYSGTANCAYYFTNQNIIHNYASGTINNNSIISFPIGQVTASGDDFYANISQVFDGIGYIGNTVFVDKGVKLFSSDGRYEDGTLKNIEYTTPELNLASNISTGTYLRTLLYCAKGTGSIVAGVTIYEQNTTPPASSSGYERWFNPGENLWYNHQANETIWQKDTNRLVRIGSFASSSGNITSMNLHSAFRAVNYDWVTEHLHSLYSRQGIIESYVNGNSGYNLYSNGYCEQWGSRSAMAGEAELTVKLLKPFKNTNYNVMSTSMKNAHTGSAGGSAVVKTSSLTTTQFTLIQDTFADNGGFWCAKGYV